MHMIIKAANRLSHVKEYYFSTKLREIRQMITDGTDVLNLGIGNPDFMPSENTIEALVQSAKTTTHHGYQSYKGIPDLRKAMAAWYERIYNVILDFDTEILPLIGSKEGIMHISMAFLNEGDAVLVPNPGYPTYTAVSKLVGAKIITYDLDESKGWNIDIEKLRKLDLSKVKIMWVNFPNMPTGALGDTQVLEELVVLAKEHQFLIVNDNPYSMILNEQPKSMLAIDGAKDVVLELNSLSKSHNMAGWRMGWVSGKKEYIETILKIKSNMDSGMFLPVQHAAIAALKNTDEWHIAQNNIYKKRREVTKELLDLLGCVYDNNQSGLFIWAKIPEAERRVEDFVDEILQKAHVFITPGFIFGSNGERYVRVSLCNDVNVLQEAMKRIKETLNSPSESLAEDSDVFKSTQNPL